MKIYLIRHGETKWNKQHLLQGKMDLPLNENGVYVARLTAEGIRQVKFDAVYSSPLKRAYETAQLVTEGRYPIQVDKRLEEIGFGPYEGYCCSREGYNIPDPEFIYFFTDPGKYVAPEGGESLQSLCRRTCEFIRELVENPENAEKTILVSTHGAALRSILVGLFEIPYDKFWEGGVHRNCGISILDVTDGKITLEQEGVIYYDEALSTNYE